MYRFSLLFCLAVCTIFVTGCDIFGGGGGDSESRPPSGGDFTYSKKAETVDVGEVSVAEKTGSEIVFQTSGTNLDIEKGEVIVSEVPKDQLETAPRFLREVESVSKEGDQITVSTSSASLVDAVEEASLNLSTSLNGKSKGAGEQTWKVTSVAEGVTVKSCNAVELGNVALQPDNSNIQVTLKNGTISFCPDINVTIDISNSSLKKFSTTASGSLTYNTDLSASASAGVDLSNSTELATFESYGTAGPVIYTMELSLVAGFQASAGGSMSMETGIESSGSLELGAQYQEGEWSPVSSRDLSFNSRPVEWGREAGATVRGYVRPELTVFLYETAGPTLFTGPYVELVAEKSEDLVTKDYQYGAFGGLNGGVGFDIEILEFGIAEYEKPIFDLRTEIAGVGPTNPAPNEPSSPDPTDGSETSGTNPILQWDASDPDNDDLTYDVYFGTSSSPSLAASDLTSKSYDPGSLQNETTYYWKVEVTDQDGATTEGPVWSFATPSSDGGDPPSEGLVAHYPFDGNANDASGNGHDGTINGDPQFVSGVDGQALNFDGNDDFVKINGYNGIQGDTSRTISFWFKSSYVRDHTWIQWGSNGNGNKYSIEARGPGDTCNIHIGVRNGNYRVNSTVCNNDWHLITIVFPDSVEMVRDHKIYVDGNLNSDIVMNNEREVSTGSGIDVRIAKTSTFDNQDWVKGTMDEVRIYNRALSESEVQDLYDAEE